MYPAASLLKEKHHGVLISSVQLCNELCKASKDALEHIRRVNSFMLSISGNFLVSIWTKSKYDWCFTLLLMKFYATAELHRCSCSHTEGCFKQFICTWVWYSGYNWPVSSYTRAQAFAHLGSGRCRLEWSNEWHSCSGMLLLFFFYSLLQKF